jgi:hypothetical protein
MRFSARRLAHSAAALVFGAGLALVVADPAAAANCTLTINPSTTPGFYTVAVGCGPNVTVDGFALWGQDFPFDEFRAGGFRGPVATVSRDVLNEDDSFFNSEDEIYAKVGWHDIFGGSDTATMTNVIHRSF